MGANGFSYNLRLRGRALPQKLKNFHQDLFFTDGQSLTHARTPTNQTVHFSKQKSERKKCSILWISIKLNFSSLIAPEKKNRWYRCVNPLFKGVQRGYKSISQVYTCRSWKQSNWFIAYQRKATSHLFGKVLILTDFGNTSMFITFNSLSSFQWLYLISFVT